MLCKNVLNFFAKFTGKSLQPSIFQVAGLGLINQFQAHEPFYTHENVWSGGKEIEIEHGWKNTTRQMSFDDFCEIFQKNYSKELWIVAKEYEIFQLLLWCIWLSSMPGRYVKSSNNYYTEKIWPSLIWP